MIFIACGHWITPGARNIYNCNDLGTILRSGCGRFLHFSGNIENHRISLIPLISHNFHVFYEFLVEIESMQKQTSKPYRIPKE